MKTAETIPHLREEVRHFTKAVERNTALGRHGWAKFCQSRLDDAKSRLEQMLIDHRGGVADTVDPYAPMAHAARKTTHVIVGDHDPEPRRASAPGEPRLTERQAWLNRIAQPDLIITEDGNAFFTEEGTGQIIDRSV